MMIKLEKVFKKFGQIGALHDVNLEIKKGEFVFITCISGSGKTTLLRMLTRDLIPDKGQVIVNGIKVAKLKSNQVHLLQMQVGVVFQDFKLLMDRTVNENIAMALRVAGIPTKSIDKQIKKTLKLVGLETKENQLPLQLAGGELQRVCLARAVVANPPILFADEPTGNLDPTTAWQIMELLKRVNELGTTVVMATHNMDIVNSMSERIIQLDKGSVIKDTNPGKYQS